MKFMRYLTPLVALALTASAVHAQVPTPTPSSGEVKFLGFNGAKYDDTNIDVGPASLMIQYPGGKVFDAFCVDYLNGIDLAHYTANFTSIQDLISNASNLDRVRFGNQADAISKYKRAVWLATQFATNAPGVGNATWAGIHDALWGQFTPNPLWGTLGDPWLTAAGNADLSGFNWNNWVIVSDASMQDHVGGNQEFLVYVAPEPGTIILLGSGLVAVLGAAVLSKRMA